MTTFPSPAHIDRELRLGDTIIFRGKPLVVEECWRPGVFKIDVSGIGIGPVRSRDFLHEPLSVLTERVKALQPKLVEVKPGMLIRGLRHKTEVDLVVEVRGDDLKVLRQGSDTADGQSLNGSPDASKIEVKWHWEPETAWRAIFPAKPSKFKVGEVWKGPNGHLMKVISVSPLLVSVIHSPAGAYPYDPANEFKLDSEGLYYGNKSDGVSLIERVSP